MRRSSLVTIVLALKFSKFLPVSTSFSCTSCSKASAVRFQGVVTECTHNCVITAWEYKRPKAGEKMTSHNQRHLLGGVIRLRNVAAAHRTFWPIQLNKKHRCHIPFAFKFAKPGIYRSSIFSKCLPYTGSARKLGFVFTGNLFRHFPLLRQWISVLVFVESRQSAAFLVLVCRF